MIGETTAAGSIIKIGVTGVPLTIMITGVLIVVVGTTDFSIAEKGLGRKVDKTTKIREKEVVVTAIVANVSIAAHISNHMEDGQTT